MYSLRQEAKAVSLEKDRLSETKWSDWSRRLLSVLNGPGK
jgi:hypothetical protein